MAGKPEEISNIIKEQIRNYKTRVDMGEVGTVVLVGDGIASVYGLRNCMSTELLEFDDGSVGLAQNLENDTVSVAILSDKNDIREGTKVKRTGTVLSIPVGESFLGRVVNPLGEPIDGKGPIFGEARRPVEAEAPGIIERQSVSTPLQTGIKAIDSMIPIGRGQRELIIGDRQTGKTEIAIDTIINQKDKNVICIYVAIGQKATSVVSLVSDLVREGAMAYTIVVSATAAESAPVQYIAPYSGCAMACQNTQSLTELCHFLSGDLREEKLIRVMFFTSTQGFSSVQPAYLRSLEADPLPLFPLSRHRQVTYPLIYRQM